MALPDYTMYQMVDKELITIQSTGLFSQSVLEWNGLLLKNETWSNLKSQFCEAYKAYLDTGAGKSAKFGYANNAAEENNDNSLDTIRDGFSALSMANNATAKRNNESMAELRAVIVATQKQLSMLASSRAAPDPWGGATQETVETTYVPEKTPSPAQPP